MAQHTKEDVAKWISDYDKHLGRGPQALADFFNAEKPQLQTRVNIFLHRFYDYGLRLIDDAPCEDECADPTLVRRIFSGWASTLIGPDAHTDDVIDGGYQVLFDHVKRKLGL